MSNFVMDGYKLVWSDEFDGDTLDMSKWSYQYLMPGNNEMKVVTDDPAIISVSNGELHLKSILYKDEENPNIKYGVMPTITTRDSMSFTYGYLEMRARIPFKKGGWPSLWLTSRDALNGKPIKPYSSEVDIFENFGSETEIAPCLHKWYNDENGKKAKKHSQCSKEARAPFSPPNSGNLSNEYHIIGFCWTPESLEMFFDGESYRKYDLSYNFDNESDMSDFVNGPLRIMVNNHLFTESSKWKPCPDCIVEDELFPIEYDIDYIRLYQKPEIGKINLAEK